MPRLQSLSALLLAALLVPGCKDETKPNVPPTTVSDLAIEAVTASSVTVTWTSPRDDCRAGCACAYDIRYSRSPIHDSNWGSASIVVDEPSPCAAGTRERYQVRDLGPIEPAPPGATGATTAWTYYVAIKACDGTTGCWSGMSNVASATLPIR
jgi:hypothetical protein